MKRRESSSIKWLLLVGLGGVVAQLLGLWPTEIPGWAAFAVWLILMGLALIDLKLEGISSALSELEGMRSELSDLRSELGNRNRDAE